MSKVNVHVSRLAEHDMMMCNIRIVYILTMESCTFSTRYVLASTKRLRLLPRTPDTFYTRLKTVIFGRAGIGIHLNEALYIVSLLLLHSSN